jgi:hypothetical protein
MLAYITILFVNHSLILTGFCNIDYTESASTSPDPFQLGAITANGAVVSKALWLEEYPTHAFIDDIWKLQFVQIRPWVRAGLA